MNIEKEARKLLEMDYSSDNEKDVVFSFARTVTGDRNTSSLKTVYYDYFSFRRNSPLYNEYASDIIEKIYNSKIRKI